MKTSKGGNEEKREGSEISNTYIFKEGRQTKTAKSWSILTREQCNVSLKIDDDGISKLFLCTFYIFIGTHAFLRSHRKLAVIGNW